MPAALAQEAWVVGHCPVLESGGWPAPFRESPGARPPTGFEPVLRYSRAPPALDLHLAENGAGEAMEHRGKLEHQGLGHGHVTGPTTAGTCASNARTRA